MSYNIRLYYSNDEIKLYKTSSDLWFAVDIKSGKLLFLDEKEAIEKVYESTNDIDLTCRIINGEIQGPKDDYNQMIALILSLLHYSEAAEVLIKLPEDMQADVAMRIALLENTSPTDITFKITSMRTISPEQLKKIKEMVDFYLHKGDIINKTPPDGVKILASLLEYVNVGHGQREAILEKMSKESPQLTAQIRKLIYAFNDLVDLDDHAIQLILKEVGTKELAVALKGASAELIEKIFGNVSGNTKETIKEEMDYMGPTRMSVVEESQRRIIDIVRRLEEEQQIVIVRGWNDKGEIFV